MTKVAKRTLKKYPDSDEVLKPKGEVEDVDEDLSEEEETALLGELEVLLGADEGEDEEEEEDKPAD